MMIFRTYITVIKMFLERRVDKKRSRGWIEIIVGSMFSGKTEELLRRLRRARIARMIVAMFLTKNLLIDWREGERFFMQHLIDGCLAANNGGWQWSASTGTDAVPYFRVFNPVSQSQRFDPNGDFIRRWIPELKHLSNKEIHQPKLLAGLFGTADYPKPIVDLSASRLRALAAFKSLPRAADL